MLQRRNMFATAFIATLIFGFALGDYTSPVFLWGTKSVAKSSLQTVNQDDFAQLVAPLLDKFMVVAFQEENLSSRDFLCHTDNAQQSCYAHLQGYSPKTYYASVQNPNEALRSLTESREYNIVDRTGKLQAPLECTTGKVNFISFDDVNEDQRAETLESHDAAIAEITKDLNNCAVVYLYMSTPTNAVTLKRTRRTITTAANVQGTMFRSGDDFMIFWTNLTYNDGSTNVNTPITVTSMELVNRTVDTKFDVVLTAGNGKKLTFNIAVGTDKYFTLSNAVYDEKTFYTSLLTAPTTFSYHCGDLSLTTVPKPGSTDKIATLNWDALQFQAPFSKTANLTKFGDAWDCVPFFSPAILAGLFVVIILLGIMFVGICWMVDINTMDRFDDPKGKTITINANE